MKNVMNDMPLNTYACHAQERLKTRHKINALIRSVYSRNNFCKCKQDKIPMCSLLLLWVLELV